MADASTGSREQILKRVRAAVKQTAPKQGCPTLVSPDFGETGWGSRLSSITGPVFPPVTDPLARFQEECAANHTECTLTEDRNGTVAVLQQVLASLPDGELFAQDSAELHELLSHAAGARPLRWSSQGAPAKSSQATISLCEALVAMTGSVLVSSRCGGRGISVVAPCHVVIAHLRQLVPDLESALARAHQIAFDNSFVGLISGCSRTADIEKLLVIGAHGPRRVVVILEK
jgi:L-lactate dehydrogenase complex protein LldG